MEWIETKDYLPILVLSDEAGDGKELYKWSYSEDVLLDYDGDVVMGRYEVENYTEGEKFGVDIHWTIYTEEGLDDVEFNKVTAWMPLPKPRGSK